MTIPTAMSVEPIGPFTYCGRTGSVAPMLSRTSRVTANSAANVDRTRGSNARPAPRSRSPSRRGFTLRPPVPPARSSARLILPLAVFGSESANSTIRGYLYGAVCCFDVFLKLAGELVAGFAGAEDDDRADDRAALGIGGRNRRGLGDRRV